MKNQTHVDGILARLYTFRSRKIPWLEPRGVNSEIVLVWAVLFPSNSSYHLQQSSSDQLGAVMIEFSIDVVARGSSLQGLISGTKYLGS